MCCSSSGLPGPAGRPPDERRNTKVQKPLYFQNENQMIAGVLHTPEGRGPFAGVILCHGFTGNKVETHFLFVAMSRELERRRIASLRFDFRGSGESEGEFVDMTPSAEVSDARQALHVLAKQPEVDAARLGVIGLSLGGLVAACTAGREPAVRSVVLWAPVAETLSVLRTGDTKPQGWTDIGGLKLGAGFAEDVAKLQPVEELGRSKAPVLVLHGAADQSVPVSHGRSYVDRAKLMPGRRADIRVIEGADHTFNRVDWTQTVIEATADWLAETL